LTLNAAGSVSNHFNQICAYNREDRDYDALVETWPNSRLFVNLKLGWLPRGGWKSVTGEDGRAYAPDDAWMHAEDNFVRSESEFESHYFHSPGKAELTVPEGRIQVEVTKGFEYHLARENVTCSPQARLVIRLKPLQIPRDAHSHWASADLHVHMNYGGAYRNTPKDLVAQEEEENLFLVENLVVNKEQRIPDIAYFQTAPDPASTRNHWLLHGQEFHTSYWGLLNLRHNFLLPDYAASNTILQLPEERKEQSCLP
jgi:TolB protein